MKIFGVAEVGEYIGAILEDDEVLGDLWIKGEVTNASRSGAGHYYFSLKDDDGQLKSVLFRGAAMRCGADPRTGDEVVAHGKIAFYRPTGVCEFCVDLLYPSGVGQAQLRFEALRLKLENEGLFAPERKRALPELPRRIGLVTSETGAAIHDVVTILGRRYAIGEVVVAKSSVQGDRAPGELVAALEHLQEWRGQDGLGIDVAIIGRGGGSPDELACFNDERLARAIFASPWPVISAVGHETDFTICDFVADVRAATPSAAAELVAPDLGIVSRQIREMADRARSMIRASLDAARGDLGYQDRRLLSRAPVAEIARAKQASHDASARVHELTTRRLALESETLRGRSLQLAALSPRATLGRGYAVVTRGSSVVLRSVGEVEVGEHLEIAVADGAIGADVTRVG